MSCPEKERVAAAYDAAISRIRSWVIWSAAASITGFSCWNFIVPSLDGAVSEWIFYASATGAIAGAGWFLVCLILLSTYSHEKNLRLLEIDRTHEQSSATPP
jgi:hypothetical protein